MSERLIIRPIGKKKYTYSESELIEGFDVQFYNERSQIDSTTFELINDIQYDINHPIILPIAPKTEYQEVPLDGAALLEILPPTFTDEHRTITLKQFCSRNQGPGTITFGLPDNQGARYGSYQWSGKEKYDGKYSVLEKFISSYDELSKLLKYDIGTPMFDTVWKELTDEIPNFNDLEKAFLDNLVEKTLSHMPDLKLAGRSFGEIEAIYSCINTYQGQAVQFLKNATRSINDIGNPTELMNNLYAERLQIKKYLKDSLVRQFTLTKDVYIKRVKNLIREKFIINEQIGTQLGTAFTKLTDVELPSELSFNLQYGSDTFISNKIKEVEEGIISSIPKGIIPTNFEKEENGFLDPYKEFPLNTRLDEPDYDRLSRAITENTPIDFRTKRKKQNIPLVEGETWSEPDPYYQAKYPHNDIVGTQGGIVIEKDNTPGKERVHIYHPSNTFIEIDHEGNINIRNAKDRFDIVDENCRYYVGKDYHRTVGENRTSKVLGNETEEITKNSKITIDGQQDIEVKKDRNIIIRQNSNLLVEEDQTFSIEGNQDTTIDKNNTEYIKEDQEVTVDGDDILTVGGDQEIIISGNATITVNGNTDLNVSGEVNMTSGGQFKIN